MTDHRRLSYSHRKEVLGRHAWVFQLEAHQSDHLLLFDKNRREFILAREGFSSRITRYLGVVDPGILRTLPAEEFARAIAETLVR